MTPGAATPHTIYMEQSVKAPCGGEAAGKSPVDRGKQGTKRSLLTDDPGIPVGCVVAPANRNDSPLLRTTRGKTHECGAQYRPVVSRVTDR